MEVVFLGTGGGRINLIKQARATGGFRINSPSANIHVDPGPGALVRCVDAKQDPMTLDAIIVSHDHTDHVTDARVLIEAMSGYALKKKGVLIASRRTVLGDGQDEPAIGRWHRELCAELYPAVFGERKRFSSAKGSFEIEIIKMQHEEPTTFGFRLFLDGKVLGYVSDTEYIESFGKDFSGCDLLIVNCIKPSEDGYKGHLKLDDVVKIAREAKPKKCVITHLGMKMLREGPAKLAEKAAKESGVEMVAAKDGMKLVV
ncbi:MAG: MBL fold metallo-hydrolase [Candidatus Micrarchaeota archaeon]